ncbi:MAG: PadR family transcriptional regulator [Thermoleophilia bacterium]|nr:PadR family transcriptional regulator [Thermoleophilia bacterium]
MRGEPGGWHCGEAGGRRPGRGRYRRSILETCILALLAASPAHGYELFDQIEQMTGDLICADAGTMYRLLRMMEEQGWVTSSWETPQTGPSRRIYALTETGLEALKISADRLRQRAEALERLADWAAQAAAPAQTNRN